MDALMISLISLFLIIIFTLLSYFDIRKLKKRIEQNDEELKKLLEE